MIWSTLILPMREGVFTVMKFSPKIGPDAVKERLRFEVKPTFAQKFLGENHPKARPPSEVFKFKDGSTAPLLVRRMSL